MACHFTYRMVFSGVNFYGGNGAPLNPYWELTNTDGTEYNTANNPNNDWFSVIKKIKCEAVKTGLSDIALYFNSYLDVDPDTFEDVEVYEIGSNFGSNYSSLIGYNPSTKKITITKLGKTATQNYSNPFYTGKQLTDYTFDSGAGSKSDFYTHLIRDLYEGYVDTEENRAMMTYISNSMGGPQLMNSGEQTYFGQAISLEKLSELPMDKLAEIISCSHPMHSSLYVMMTLCKSSDSDQSKCAIKSISLNDAETITASAKVIDGTTSEVVVRDGITYGRCTIDLDAAENDWVSRIQKMHFKTLYW